MEALGKIYYNPKYPQVTRERLWMCLGNGPISKLQVAFRIGLLHFFTSPGRSISISQDKSHEKLDKFPMALHSPSNLWVEMAMRPN